MFADFVLVDLDAEPGFLVREDDPAFLLDGVSLLDDILPPGDVVGDGFADDVTRLGETELETGSGADRSLRIVGRKSDPVGFGEGGDPARFRESAAVGDVELADLAAAGVEEILELGEVSHSFTGRDWCGQTAVDMRQTVD